MKAYCPNQVSKLIFDQRMLHRPVYIGTDQGFPGGLMTKCKHDSYDTTKRPQTALTDLFLDISAGIEQGEKRLIPAWLYTLAPSFGFRLKAFEVLVSKLWAHLGSSGLIWAHLGSSGLLRAPPGSSGLI